MPEEIKQVVTVDAAEAIRKLNELTGVEHKLAGAGEKVTGATKKSSDALEKQGGITTEVGAAVHGLVGRWLSLLAIAETILAFFRSLGDAAKTAAKAVADTGKAVGDMAKNFGGKGADETFLEVARKHRMGQRRTLAR